MRLQLALDLDSVAAAAAVLEKTADLVDIVEVGTPLVLREGAKAIRALKEGFPGLVLLADFKIMDAGKEEAEIAFEAGADIVTVLAAAEITTIRRACEAARNAGRDVMADLIAVSGVARRAMEVSAAGVSYLCCHTAFDMQSSGPTRHGRSRRCAPRSPARGWRRLGASRPSASACSCPWRLRSSSWAALSPAPRTRALPFSRSAQPCAEGPEG